MTNQVNYRVTWRVVDRHVEPRGDTEIRKDEDLAIGLVVSYQGQECDISIALPPPPSRKPQENKAVALAELRRLRNAPNDILGER